MSLDARLQTNPERIGDTPVEEARRQVEICNACRYCEGFCAVFPAIMKQKVFADGDITQLANLCHNCRGCYYSCQYSEPHEYAVNIPRVLAEVRTQSWTRLSWPGGPAGLFQKHGVALAAAFVAGIAAMVLAIRALPGSGDGFYLYLGHAAMVAIFAPAFLLPLAAVGIGLRRYWREVGGERVRWGDLRDALAAAATLRNLSGGQGQGCNFEKGDRYTDTRRWMHQAVLYGFLLCFASTSSATVLHYAFAREAPYDFWSLPKLLGVPGGILMVIGGAALAWLNARADPRLGAPEMRGGEMAFVLLVILVAASGLLLYAATGTAAVEWLLAMHLGAVLAFFLLMPYSKMVHGFYRFAALLRDAQVKRRSAGPSIAQGDAQ